MKIFIETERLILREIILDDAAEIFNLDSKKEVLRYLPVKTLNHIDETIEIINHIRNQYKENDIGRWAVVLKETQEFIGWCGIKYIKDEVVNGKTNFYDIGYRLMPEFWGKGYASEASMACFNYAFDVLKLTELHATIMEGNQASCKIVEKIGMIKMEDFVEDNKNWHWYTMKNDN